MESLKSVNQLNRSMNFELFELIVPLELKELLLMRVFMKRFTELYKSHYKTHEAIKQLREPVEYSTLAAVCYNWWQTMNGWTLRLPTRHRFRLKLHRAIKYICRPFLVFPKRLSFDFPMSRYVFGVTQCDNKLFVVCERSNIIRVFGSSDGKQIGPNIELEELNSPSDIVSCSETQQLFIADCSFQSRDSTGCVWRVSLNGRQVVKWLPNNSTTTSLFRPWTLSVTSRRLLVTSTSNNELLLYGADGVELKRVSIPDMNDLQHAVETSRGTFIVCHLQPHPTVSEVSADGHVIHTFSGKQQLKKPVYLSLDTDGRVLVADKHTRHILLLSSRLELERILLDGLQHSLTWNPFRLCYTEQTGQLAVGGYDQDELIDHQLSWFDLVQLFTVR